MASLNQTADNVEFTKKLVQALLYEKFDDKGKGKQIAEYVKDLKDCTMKWYEKNEKSHLLEEERLRALIDLTEKKCTDTEKEMRNTVDEINAMNSNLGQRIATIKEKLAKEELEKMNAITSLGREREAREAAETLQVSLLGKLEQVQEEISFAEQRASKLEDDINRTLEETRSLEEYNCELVTDLSTLNEARKRVEIERLTNQMTGKLNMVEKLSKLWGA